MDVTHTEVRNRRFDAAFQRCTLGRSDRKIAMNTPPDPATAKLIEQLDALGATYAREARERGVAESVCAASLVELNRAPAVAGRLHW